MDRIFVLSKRCLCYKVLAHQRQIGYNWLFFWSKVSFLNIDSGWFSTIRGAFHLWSVLQQLCCLTACIDDYSLRVLLCEIHTLQKMSFNRAKKEFFRLNSAYVCSAVLPTNRQRPLKDRFRISICWLKCLFVLERQTLSIFNQPLMQRLMKDKKGEQRCRLRGCIRFEQFQFLLPLSLCCGGERSVDQHQLSTFRLSGPNNAPQRVDISS